MNQKNFEQVLKYKPGGDGNKEWREAQKKEMDRHNEVMRCVFFGLPMPENWHYCQWMDE
jgi:hypothetical protein